jgi:hypothetical protein
MSSREEGCAMDIDEVIDLVPVQGRGGSWSGLSRLARDHFFVCFRLPARLCGSPTRENNLWQTDSTHPVIKKRNGKVIAGCS